MVLVCNKLNILILYVPRHALHSTKSRLVPVKMFGSEMMFELGQTCEGHGSGSAQLAVQALGCYLHKHEFDRSQRLFYSHICCI